MAFEAGYRTSLAANLSFDIAGFYNIYDNLRSLEPQPVVFDPGQSGETIKSFLRTTEAM